MPAPIAPALWAEIRHHWEYDPDSPSFAQAANRAASAHDFKAPGRSAVCRRADAERWTRRGSMAGVNEVAQLKADVMTAAGNAARPKNGLTPVDSAARAQVARDEASDVRAAIVNRHRQEWDVVGELMAEAMARRAIDVADAFNRAKLAKITAETVAIKQLGERRAWGMDVPDVTDLSKMTDAQLEALIAGKAVT